MNKTTPRVTKKTVTSKKKVAKKKVAAKKRASTKGTKTSIKNSGLVSPRERYEMIATMAYYRAEQRNFEPGYDVSDWLECESIIDQMLSR